MILFLDANILFSSAKGGASFALLWELASLGKVELTSSEYCVREAVHNLRRKSDEASLERFFMRLKSVRLVQEPSDQEVSLAIRHVVEKDAPVLAAAMKAGAHVLITGDIRDFGHLMPNGVACVRIQTIRYFLNTDQKSKIL
jgi:predicted nucleic acid-binding protein